MYFLPIGLFTRWAAPASFCEAIRRTAADYPRLTWDTVLVRNLLPVTLGSIIGGAVLVGAVYWFVYLRAARREFSND
jgi:formate transporter